MTAAAQEARRAYRREWNKRNPDKVKAATERYWAKKAREAEQAQKAQEEEQAQ